MTTELNLEKASSTRSRPARKHMFLGHPENRVIPIVDILGCFRATQPLDRVARDLEFKADRSVTHPGSTKFAIRVTNLAIGITIGGKPQSESC